MTPRQQRRWPWYEQILDATVAALGIVIASTMLIRDSWPVIGVVFAMMCLGRITSSATIKYLLGRWEQDRK